MLSGAENPALSVSLFPIDNQTIDNQITDCYHAGDPILWWLNEKSNNPDTQRKKTEILSKLAAGNYDTQTRIDIGDDHETTPLEVHAMLAIDENPDVRYALAENHNIDKSVLNILVEDAHPYVAQRAQKTLARLKEPAVIVALVPKVRSFKRSASNAIGS